MGGFGEIAFTNAVRAVQERMGSRATYTRAAAAEKGNALGPDEVAFIGSRDSFYMASTGETGWPYIQHRGGPKGFVRVLDPHRIGFADYRGNRQYISVGNVTGDDRVALIFVDYPNQARLKILAHASILTSADDPQTFALLTEGVKASRVERVFVLRVEGFDWNCPQNITPRFTEEEVRRIAAPLMERIDALEAENGELRAELGRKGAGA